MPAAPLAWLLAPNWHGQGLIWCPAVPQAVGQCLTLDTDYFSPLRDRVRLPLEGDAMAAARVVALMLLSGPAAILGRVRAVIVDAIKGMPRRRSAADVTQERCKGRAPLSADVNPSRAVQMEVPIVRILAATDDVRPGHIFRRLVAAPSVAVAMLRGSGAFALQAAATLRHAGFQVRRHHGLCSAAFTDAFPMCFAMTYHWAKDAQPAEYLPAQVYGNSRHMNILTR